MYKDKSYIKLTDTDAAGILFFANYIKLAHDVYEKFIDTIGYSLSFIINDAAYYLLIAHTEADYKKPLKLGEEYECELLVERIGKTSFTLYFKIKNVKDELCCEVRTVHVATDKKSGKPVRLEDDLKAKLGEFI